MKKTYLKPELNDEIIEMDESVMEEINPASQIDIPGGGEGTLDARMFDPTDFDVVDALGFKPF
jgi:hypothetical protein